MELVGDRCTRFPNHSDLRCMAIAIGLGVRRRRKDPSHDEQRVTKTAVNECGRLWHAAGAASRECTSRPARELDRVRA